MYCLVCSVANLLAAVVLWPSGGDDRLLLLLLHRGLLHWAEGRQLRKRGGRRRGDRRGLVGDHVVLLGGPQVAEAVDRVGRAELEGGRLVDGDDGGLGLLGGVGEQRALVGSGLLRVGRKKQ